MAAVKPVQNMSETDSSLVSQCMDYTKQLASQGKDFKFSLSLPSGFNFSLEFIQEKMKDPNILKVKKKSPSTLRRNTQRKKEFLEKKALEKHADSKNVESKSMEGKVKCVYCKEEFVTDIIMKKHIAENHLAIVTSEDSENKNNDPEDMAKNTQDENIIEQLDGNAEIEESDEEYYQKQKEYDQKLEQECKADGSWCYECSDIFKNKIVLKRHMHNDHNMEIYPDINIMLHGGW